MLRTLTGAIVALAGLVGVALQAAPASAMPMVDRTPAVASQVASGAAQEQVRWACGPYGCSHGPRRAFDYRRPRFYLPPAYNPPVYYRPVHRWHRSHFYRPAYGYGYRPAYRYRPAYGYRHAYRYRPAYHHSGYGPRPYGFYNPYRRHFRHHGYYRPHRWHHYGYGGHHRWHRGHFRGY